MKKLFFILIPAIIYAEDLKSILEYAHKNNNLVLSSKYTKDAKVQEVASKKSDFFPKIDIGASYKNTSNTTFFQINEIYAGYAKVEVDIYDGGVKSSLVDKAKNELSASSYDEAHTKKSLSLQIAEEFYALRSLEALLRAKEDSKNSIQEQLERIKKFYDAKLATNDDIQRLQAAFDKNIYDIESVKFEMLSVKKSLEWHVGKEIKILEKSNFKDIQSTDVEQSDAIKSLSYKSSAIQNSAKVLEGIYYPRVKLEDSYTLYGYNNIMPNHPAKIDRQNILMLSLNMRIFDYGATKEARETLILSSKALEQQQEYLTKEQLMNYEVSISRVNSAKLKIKSAKSALISSASAFRTINEKYNAGIVDFVVYLDALSSKTEASATYEKSLNDLEVAYAMFYYHSGKKLEEFIK